ncbi:methionyl-tRNA formyltransferase [Candidatus Saccharibacteria bacterium]|nr:methionyl-tRNA formyltransferase [Candidatus Saccharibacteria bacterium]NCS83114.1 methionyl-tRNA formyltransferase [Candidatus Saccharibacteria bacterium]
MNTSKTIVFFGTDDFSAVSLQALIDSGASIAAVVTKPDSRRGRGRDLKEPAVKQIAKKYNIPVWQPMKLSEIESQIEALDSPLGVLVSYGKIIPERIIKLFEPGIVNVHPSLLPKYRGPSPIESAILNGDSETGVSIMQLSAAMDAGPVYAQVRIPLSGKETAPGLEISLAHKGAEQLLLSLDGIIDGSLQPTPQNDTNATYCPLLQKDDAQLEPTSLTATQAERRIRAYLSFPKTKTTLHNQLTVITKAHVAEDGPLVVKCADATFLTIDELIGPSGKTMTAEAFINGYGPTRR